MDLYSRELIILSCMPSKCAAANIPWTGANLKAENLKPLRYSIKSLGKGEGGEDAALLFMRAESRTGQRGEVFGKREREAGIPKLQA